MIDYFALLGQPRSPWLDAEQLKDTFHAKTLLAHPDTQGEQNSTAFTQLNEAFQVLRDPKRRLQHLLTLAGETPAGRGAAIPKEVEELFPAVARLTSEADAVLQKMSAATSALSLSLIRPELLRTRAEVEQMLARLRELHTAAENELRTADISATEALQQLYLRFSYLGRWLAELEEKLLRLSI